VPVDDFNYDEQVDGRDHDKYLWESSAYTLAACVTRAFATYRWCAAIRGAEGGGLVEELPCHRFTNAEGDVEVKCPTEVNVTDRCEKALSDLGLATLVHFKGKDYATFFGNQTCHAPRSVESPRASANAKLSAQLSSVLAASRFAHLVKAIARSQAGGFASSEALGAELNRRLLDYRIDRDDIGQEQRARFPLREGRVDVAEGADGPGSYSVVLHVRPHFQMEELTEPMRITIERPAPG
jgi:type VI secretion system protein ImpC